MTEIHEQKDINDPCPQCKEPYSFGPGSECCTRARGKEQMKAFERACEIQQNNKGGD